MILGPYRPAMLRFRDGSRKVLDLPKGYWEEAIVKHQRSAHEGKFDASCAGCRELREKARTR